MVITLMTRFCTLCSVKQNTLLILDLSQPIQAILRTPVHSHLMMCSSWSLMSSFHSQVRLINQICTLESDGDVSNIWWMSFGTAGEEFLAARQERSKWVQMVPNVKVGDIVLIKEDSPRNCWPLARVTAVTGSDDGCVRSVTLKTKSSTLHRPIHKILVLIHNISD